MASNKYVSSLTLISLVFFFTLSGAIRCPTPSPEVKPEPKPTTTGGSCPVDMLKLSVCAGSAVGGLLAAVQAKQCCGLLDGLADADAAVCLCTALKGQAAGVKLTVPVDLSVLFNYCKVPKDFQCA